MVGTIVLPIVVGVLLGLIYTGLLIGPIMRRLGVFKPYTFLWTISSICLRMAVVAVAVCGMLHYSINHLILMMIAFYATVVALMIAYKGGR